MALEDRVLQGCGSVLAVYEKEAVTVAISFFVFFYCSTASMEGGGTCAVRIMMYIGLMSLAWYNRKQEEEPTALEIAESEP